MKKMLIGTTALAALMLAGAAQAADLPYKAPPPPAPPPFSWTGWYIGAHVGAGWGTKDWSDVREFELDFPSNSEFVGGPMGSHSVSGFLGGGQIGYNWQSGWVVFGIEADASGADIKGSGFCVVSIQCSSKIDALGTITGRIGGALDRALLYLKGGGAWVNEKHTLGFIEGIDSFTSSSSKTRWGWTVGGGVEVAFTNYWSGKIEYNFMDFGTNTRTFAFPNDDLGVDLRVRQQVHAVKMGLNYHFNWGGVAARY